MLCKLDTLWPELAGLEVGGAARLFVSQLDMTVTVSLLLTHRCSLPAGFMAVRLGACSSGTHVPQAAEASVRVAAAMAALGCCAEMANLRADLPLLLGAAPALTRARAQMALAEGLLVATSAAQLSADPDRCAQVGGPFALPAAAAEACGCERALSLQSCSSCFLFVHTSSGRVHTGLWFAR